MRVWILFRHRNWYEYFWAYSVDYSLACSERRAESTALLLLAPLALPCECEPPAKCSPLQESRDKQQMYAGKIRIYLFLMPVGTTALCEFVAIGSATCVNARACRNRSRFSDTWNHAQKYRQYANTPDSWLERVRDAIGTTVTPLMFAHPQLYALHLACKQTCSLAHPYTRPINAWTRPMNATQTVRLERWRLCQRSLKFAITFKKFPPIIWSMTPGGFYLSTISIWFVHRQITRSQGRIFEAKIERYFLESFFSGEEFREKHYLCTTLFPLIGCGVDP